MKGFKREKVYKVCPRCHEKTFVQAVKCDNCHLIFDRLKYASNKLAKKAIAKGEKEKVIKSSTLPKDLKKWKLALMACLGGWFGLHNIYIGRYVKGFFSLIFVLVLGILISLIDSAVLADIFSTFLFIPGAIVAVTWIVDLFKICINKYPVPIALDIPEVSVNTETKIDINQKDEENKDKAEVAKENSEAKEIVVSPEVIETKEEESKK